MTETTTPADPERLAEAERRIRGALTTIPAATAPVVLKDDLWLLLVEYDRRRAEIATLEAAASTAEADDRRDPATNRRLLADHRAHAREQAAEIERLQAALRAAATVRISPWGHVVQVGDGGGVRITFEGDTRTVEIELAEDAADDLTGELREALEVTDRG